MIGPKGAPALSGWWTQGASNRHERNSQSNMARHYANLVRAAERVMHGVGKSNSLGNPDGYLLERDVISKVAFANPPRPSIWWKEM